MYKGLNFLLKEYRDPRLFKQQYYQSSPFPHIQIDNFINEELIHRVESEFPNLKLLENKLVFKNQKEIKFASKGSSDLSPAAKELIGYLNSDIFLKYLQDLTSINETLISDPYLTGGGYHEIKKGGLFKVHADFNKHPMLNLDRRINLLIYLNKEWQPDWGGNLELYSKNNLKTPSLSIEPKFNRCVIFTTNSNTFHGNPEKVKCPDSISRKSIALYYFSTGRPNDEINDAHNTLFVETKGDKFKRKYFTLLQLKSFINEWLLPPGFYKGIKKVLKKI